MDALRVLSTTVRSLIIGGDAKMAYDYGYNSARTALIKEHLRKATEEAYKEIDDDASSSDDEVILFFIYNFNACFFSSIKLFKRFLINKF